MASALRWTQAQACIGTRNTQATDEAGGSVEQKDEPLRDRWGRRSLTNPFCFWLRKAVYASKTFLKTTAFPVAQPQAKPSQRVIAFLEFLPITKGILRDKRMVLLPHQREFVERVYLTATSCGSLSRASRGATVRPDWPRVSSLLT